MLHPFQREGKELFCALLSNNIPNTDFCHGGCYFHARITRMFYAPFRFAKLDNLFQMVEDASFWERVRLAENVTKELMEQ
jgi:hypothetical protein